MKRLATILLLAGTFILTGCGDSENFVFTNNNIPNAPVAVNDAYATNESTPLTVNATNGVLANDTPNGATITSFDATSTLNGTVNLNADGSFTYTPTSTGSDTFTYTLNNGTGSSSATVTITVQAVNGFFVDAANGNDTTGSFQGGNPYATIQAAVADAPTNADIIVRPGNYTGQVDLKDGQRLLGSGSALVSPQGTTRPNLTGPVVLADGNTLDFLRIANSPGAAVDGAGQDGGIVSNCQIDTTSGGTGDGVGMDGASGNWTVNNNTFTGVTGVPILARTLVNSTLVLVVSNNDLANNPGGGIAFGSEGTSDIRAQIIGNEIATSSGTGNSFETVCGDDSTICLDLENNTNDDAYAFTVNNSPSALFEIEQLSTLTDPQPGGAGNTGTVDITDDGPGGLVKDPVEVNDGDCGF
ncbi:MAG: cadherin-like domain-containing protein [Candidatus Eremiobacteraeota bacterium]|nr:cadherin-like domain-containing protein [Candidatus Eremiobacteraeota bacterium]